MMALEQTLSTRNILLDAEVADLQTAVEKAVFQLKTEVKMLDWEAFSVAVAEREKKSGTSVGGGLMLPHGRGDFVREMVMSFVRLRTALPIEGGEVGFIIAVAVPSSMAADYLRLVGALARVFRDPKSHATLHDFATGSELLAWLSERCR